MPPVINGDGGDSCGATFNSPETLAFVMQQPVRRSACEMPTMSLTFSVSVIIDSHATTTLVDGAVSLLIVMS